MSKHVFKLVVEHSTGVDLLFVTHIHIKDNGRGLEIVDQDGDDLEYKNIRNFTVDGSEWRFEQEPNYHPTKNCDYCRENNLYRHECQNCRD